MEQAEKARRQSGMKAGANGDMRQLTQQMRVGQLVTAVKDLRDGRARARGGASRSFL